ncbi:hypothetical protein COOONC_22587 [Cooperia oncophora]
MQLMVPSHSTASLQDILKFDGTDPKLLDQEFRIKGSQLLKLFRFCPSCGSKISDSTGCVSLRAAGMTPIVHYICTACSPFEKCFQGQEEAHSSEMSLGSNLEAVMTAIETELSSACSEDLFPEFATRKTTMKQWEPERNPTVREISGLQSIVQ